MEKVKASLPGFLKAHQEQQQASPDCEKLFDTNHTKGPEEGCTMNKGCCYEASLKKCLQCPEGPLMSGPAEGKKEGGPPAPAPEEPAPEEKGVPPELKKYMHLAPTFHKAVEDGKLVVRSEGEAATAAGKSMIHDAGMGFAEHIVQMVGSSAMEEEKHKLRQHMRHTEVISTNLANEALQKIAQNADEAGRKAVVEAIAGNATARRDAAIFGLRNASEHLKVAISTAVETNNGAAQLAQNAVKVAVEESNKVGKFQNSAMQATNNANWEVRKAVDFVKRGNLQAQLASQGSQQAVEKANDAEGEAKTSLAISKKALTKTKKNKKKIEKLEEKLADTTKKVGDAAREVREAIDKIFR